MATNYRIDTMVDRSKAHIIDAKRLNDECYSAQTQIIKALFTLSAAVEALMLATNNEATRYDQFNQRVIRHV